MRSGSELEGRISIGRGAAAIVHCAVPCFVHGNSQRRSPCALDGIAAVQHMRVMDFAQRYEHGIGWIVAQCPAPDKFAHTYAGLSLWLLAATLSRKPLWSWFPLSVVVCLEVANEVVDRLANGSWRWPDTLGDMAATWFWPIVLGWALRLDRRLRG